MKITPTRALVCMWLLCSLWLPGIWWMHRWLSPIPGSGLPAALPLLGGGLLLLLLAAVFLALSLRIEQTRLRIALRAVLRGEVPQAPADDWRGMLDDVRLALRRSGLERERLEARAQRAEQALREQSERAAQAAQSAQDSLLQVQQQWQRLLSALPSGEQAQARLRALQQGSAAIEGAQQRAQILGGALQHAVDALQPLAEGLREQDSAQQHEFLQQATRVAESLQLLSLNFRLALERLEGVPGARGEALDTVVQDVEPLCVLATNLLGMLPAAPPPSVARDRLLPVRKTLEELPGEAAQIVAILQQARGELDPLLPEAEAASAQDWPAALQPLQQATEEAPAG